jgi:hypothetical protein
MKPSTTELIKFIKLQRRLKESKRGTVGLLELLWNNTARQCPRGDIGKFSNEDIAILCDWDGDPDELIKTLVDCGWLDACPTYRLIVHDWQEHAPNYVRAALAKRKESFCTIVTTLASGEPSPECSPEASPEPSPEASQVTLDTSGEPSSRARAFPNLTLPNHTLPPLSVTPPNGGTNAGGGVTGLNRPSLRSIKLPSTLDAMRSDIDRWVEYLWAQDGNINAISLQSHIEKFHQHGIARAREAIDTAIDRRWSAPAFGGNGSSGNPASKKIKLVEWSGKPYEP